MRTMRLLIITISIWALAISANSQNTIFYREYVNEFGNRIEIKNDTLYYIINQSHLHVFRNDTLSICTVEQINNSFIKVTSAHKLSDYLEQIEIEYHDSRKKSDSIYIHFFIPNYQGDLDILVLGDGYKEYQPKSSDIIAIPKNEESFCFSIAPKTYTPHNVDGRYYGLLYLLSSLYIIPSQKDTINIKIPFLDNSFFEIFYIIDEYIYLGKDFLQWKGMTFKRAGQ